MHPVALQIPIIDDRKENKQSEYYLRLKKNAEDYNNGGLTLESLQQNLDDYFKNMLPYMGIVEFDFMYVISVSKYQICYQQGIEACLGLKENAINMGGLIELYHPVERSYLMKFTRRIMEFAQEYRSETPFELGFSLAHQIRKGNGDYIKVLSRIYPFIMDEHHRVQLYLCLCTDITLHHLSDKITYDILLPSNTTWNKSDVLQYFAGLISGQPVAFTKRELEVIKVWSETDSSGIAAERLGITVRTAETHLKNARRKLGARRTLDVVLFAKERGWV